MYYLIEISSSQQGTAKAIWEKNGPNEAKMAMHQTFASAIANTNVTSCLCMIIDGGGTVYFSELWNREQ